MSELMGSCLSGLEYWLAGMLKEPQGLQQGEVLVGICSWFLVMGWGGAVIHRWIIQFKDSLVLGLSCF